MGAANGSGVVSGNILNGAGLIGLTKAGSGSLVISGNNQIGNGLSVTGGTLAIGAGGTTQVVNGFAVHNTSTLLVSGSAAAGEIDIDNSAFLSGAGTVSVGGGGLFYNSTAASAFAGVVTGGGDLEMAAAGTLTLSGSSNYQGGTNIDNVAATLRVGAANALPFGPNAGGVSISTTGTLDLAGNTANINGLTGNGAVNDSTAGSGLLVVGNNNATSTFSGGLRNTAGTLALWKTGSGALTLSGSSSYAGATMVNSGRLVLGAGGALGNTAITVNPNGVFQPAVGATAGIAGGGASLALNGGLFDMASDNALGAFTLNPQGSFSGTALSLSGGTLLLDLTASSGTTGVDTLLVGNGSAVLSNGTNISLVKSGSLNFGTYPLIQLNGSGASGLSGNYFTLDNSGGTSEIINLGGQSYMLSLVNSSTAESLSVSAGFVSTQYTLAAAIQPRMMVSSTAVFTGSITNSGTNTNPSSDSLNYTLAGSLTGGSGTLGALSNSSSTGLALGATASGSSLFTASATPGIVTLTLAATATNTNLGTTASGPLSFTGTADVLGNRSINVPSITLGAAGRFMAGTTISGSAQLSSTTGDDSTATRLTVDGTGQAANLNGLALAAAGGNAYFNGSSANPTNSLRTLSGTVSTASPGPVNGSFTLSVTGKGLSGETDPTLVLAYSGTAVNNRVVTSTSASFGLIHLGQSVASQAITLSTIGADSQNTRVTVPNGSDSYGIYVSGGANPTFSNATVTDTRSIGGTPNTAGNLSCTITLATSGEGLSGESPIPVVVPYSVQVFSGSGHWTGAGGSSWGPNGNWTDLNGTGVQAAPGTWGYGDTAVLDDTAGTNGLTLDGASPHLAALVINTSGSYTLAPGSGGTLALDNGGGPAVVTLASGTGAITAPIFLSSSGSFALAPGTQMGLAGTISGANSLALAGKGTLVLGGTNNGYSGGTIVEGGTLIADTNGALPDSGALVIGAGGTFIFDPTVPASASSELPATHPGIASGRRPGTVNLGPAGRGRNRCRDSNVAKKEEVIRRFRQPTAPGRAACGAHRPRRRR